MYLGMHTHTSTRFCRCEKESEILDSVKFRGVALLVEIACMYKTTEGGWKKFGEKTEVWKEEGRERGREIGREEGILRQQKEMNSTYILVCMSMLRLYIDTYICIYVHGMSVDVKRNKIQRITGMGWLRLVGSLKL